MSSTSGPLPRPELIVWTVVGGAILGIIVLGLNYTFLFWKECKIRCGSDVYEQQETDVVLGFYLAECAK